MIEDLYRQAAHQEQLANQANDALRDLTDAMDTQTVTAPTAYAVLGNLNS